MNGTTRIADTLMVPFATSAATRSRSPSCACRDPVNYTRLNETAVPAQGCRHGCLAHPGRERRRRHRLHGMIVGSRTESRVGQPAAGPFPVRIDSAQCSCQPDEVPVTVTAPVASMALLQTTHHLAGRAAALRTRSGLLRHGLVPSPTGVIVDSWRLRGQRFPYTVN